MDRVAAPISPSLAPDDLHADEHNSSSSDTTNTIKKTSPPQMRQAQQHIDTTEKIPSGSAPIRHQIGSVSLKRRNKEKSKSDEMNGLSSALMTMSAKSLIDALMNFNMVSHDEQVMPWDSWLQSHGVSHVLIRQLQWQAELIQVLRLTLSPSFLPEEAYGQADPVSAATNDSRQRRQLCAHMLSYLAQAPLPASSVMKNADGSDQARAAMEKLAQKQANFFAEAAKAAQPDIHKLFKFQLPKVLSNAVWPEKFDEHKLSISLENMGVFGILSGVLLTLVKTARLANTQSMAGRQEDVQLLLKQTMQADFSSLALTAIKESTTALLMYAEERGQSLQIVRYLLAQFYALFDHQCDAIRQSFAMPSNTNNL